MTMSEIGMMPSENPHPSEFYTGLELFNRGFYFECHDVWEEIWGDAKGKNKIFYQALIMSAVSLYHFGNENLEGALSCLQKAERQFGQLPETFLGLNLTGFLQQMKQFFAGMTVGQTELTAELLAKPRPKIVMEVI
jgi:predicted metal-dependent hydrolase